MNIVGLQRTPWLIPAWHDPARKLRQLRAGVRRDLLKVLIAPADVRADAIRQLYAREDRRDLAEVLMDLEEEVLRLEVLRQVERSLG
ncbi:MAG TPA: hypothetical protein VGR33_03910 [Actinomycetota bacterium]|nr:hypothetical protein [Actinomycetota bacterium]